jgi:hypothetical protein
MFDIVGAFGKAASFAYDRYQDAVADTALRRLQEAVDAHGAGLRRLEDQIQHLASAGLRLGLEDLRRAESPDTRPDECDRIIEQAGDRFAEAAHSSTDPATQILSATLCAAAHAMRNHLHDAAHWSATAHQWAQTALGNAMRAEPPPPPVLRAGVLGWYDRLFGNEVSPAWLRRQWLEDHYPRVELLGHLRSVTAAYDAALRGQPPPQDVRVLPESPWTGLGREPALFDVLGTGSKFGAGEAVLSVTSAFRRPRDTTVELFVRLNVHQRGDVAATDLGVASEHSDPDDRRWVPAAGRLTTLTRPRATVRFEVGHEDPGRLAVVAHAGSHRVWVPIPRWRTVKATYETPRDLVNPWSPPEPTPEASEPYDDGPDLELWVQGWRN